MPREVVIDEAHLPTCRLGCRHRRTVGASQLTASGWALLARYDFGYEVDFAEATLTAAGIPVLVKGREAGIWGPGFAGPPSQGLSVWVPEARLSDARGLVEEESPEAPA